MAIEIINSTEGMHLKENFIGYVRVSKNDIDSAQNKIVKDLSDNFFQFLSSKDINAKLKEINKIYAKSQDIQGIF